jgi:hypothetical protein
MAQVFSEETYTQLLIHLVSEADILADRVFDAEHGHKPRRALWHTIALILAARINR